MYDIFLESPRNLNLFIWAMIVYIKKLDTLLDVDNSVVNKMQPSQSIFYSCKTNREQFQMKFLSCGEIMSEGQWSS